MSWARWAAGVAAVLVVLIVPIAMWLGLREGERPPPRERPTQPEPEPAPEAEEAEAEPEPDEEVADAPVDGVRVVHGFVTNHEDEPIEGVEVSIDGTRLRTLTDGDGGYRLRGVSLESVTLIARAAGYADARQAIAAGEPDADERHDIALEHGGAVVGLVVDHEGRPVPGAKVACVDRPADKTLTDRDGRFELPEHAAGCDAIATHPPHGDSPRVTLAIGPENLIALSRAASLGGVVVDANGRPVQRFTLSIDSFRPADPSGAPPRKLQQTFNHPEGRFALLRVDPGTYVLRVRAGGATVLSQPILVRHGEELRDVHITVP